MIYENIHAMMIATVLFLLINDSNVNAFTIRLIPRMVTTNNLNTMGYTSQFTTSTPLGSSLPGSSSSSTGACASGTSTVSDTLMEVIATSSQKPQPVLSGSLPFTSSIVDNCHLSYMDATTHQLNIMKEYNFISNDVEEKFYTRTSDVKPAQIANMKFSNDIFRNVRMTYFDGGDGVQVYNSLFYPSYEYDLPLLGIDLISLGRKRVLAVVDFQPLHPTEEYSNKYIDHLTPIREKYESLQGTLSGKIYDDTSFFSKNMLFGRYSDESKVDSDVIPAFKEYLNAYMNMAKDAVPVFDDSRMAEVKERQKAYDVYSAIKDPAVGLFDAYFGKEWSRSFVHDYLFELSDIEDQADPIHKLSS